MEKETDKPLFFRAFLIISFLFIITLIILYFNGVKLTHLPIIGHSIFEIKNINYLTPFFFVGIWAIFIFLLLYIYIRDKILYNREIKIITNELIYSGYDTDLDVLYTILKTRKHLKLKVIAKVFDIDSEKAMKWAKILESGNLVSIEYPGFFGNPEIVINNNS